MPEGTPLYDIFGVADPQAALPDAVANGGLRRLGRLVSTSRFLRSAADARLCFWQCATSPRLPINMLVWLLRVVL